jgi:integrase
MAAETWLFNERNYIDTLMARGELADYQTPRARLQSVLQTNSLTLEQYIIRYMRDKEQGGRWRGSTAQRYKGIAEQRIIPVLGNRPLPQIKPEDITIWWRSLPTDTERTNTLAYQLLRSVFRAAIRDHSYKGENPCDVNGASKGSKRREIAPLSTEQVLAISEAMPERLRLTVLLAAFCGAMRSGEVRELRCKDFDLDKGTLTIARQVTVLTDGTRVVGKPKTDAGIRTVPMPQDLIPIIRKHLHDYAQAGSEGLLFYNRRGEQLNSGDLLKMFIHAVNSVGLSGYVFHDLRRCWATFTALEQATKRERMAAGGWATPVMVERYEQVDNMHLVDITDKLNKRIQKARQAA